MPTFNPVLTVFNQQGWSGARTETMTVEGTAIKTGYLGVILLSCFLFVWHYLQTTSGLPMIVLIGSLIGSFIVAMIISWWPTTAPYLSPVYAVGEGALLGSISFSLDQSYPGIAVQAGGLTIFTLLAMMLAYRTRLIVVNDTFRSVVIGATLAIALFYLAGWIASFFDFHLPGTGFNGGWLGIGISGVITVVAALNLALDFDFIDRSAGNAPKYMEWYGAFSLLITLVWLYLEFLRLLAQLRSRD